MAVRRWVDGQSDGQVDHLRRRGRTQPNGSRKKGVKRSVAVESNGGPLGVMIAGANVHDTQLLAATLDALVLAPPFPTEEQPLHLCLDKAYDNPTGTRALADFGYVGHVRRIGEEKLDDHGEKTHPARRWVVERTMAWLAKYRSILVRYEVKPENYRGLMKLACILIWTRIWHRLKAENPD
ncbi:IS5 family transposase [Candidatus Poribacteria bacterium]|nr:IS5 family transposase [Candidatus Poribacteria bacterium]